MLYNSKLLLSCFDQSTQFFIFLLPLNIFLVLIYYNYIYENFKNIYSEKNLILFIVLLFFNLRRHFKSYNYLFY